MKPAMILILLPALLWAQEFEFELQPGAFQVEINGWQPYQPWAGGMDGATPHLSDLDADGDLDFFCGDERGYINFYQNIGLTSTPVFQYVTCLLDSLQAPGAIQSWGYSDINFVDLDSDGDKDAVLGSGYTLIYSNIGSVYQPIFDNEPDTLRETNGEYVLGPRIAMADLDYDGDYDLYAGQVYGNIRFYENIGSSSQFTFTLASSNWFNIQVVDGYTKPCFGDLDSDADLDLLVGTGAGTIYYYRNDGDSANPQMTYVTDNYFNIDVEEDASPELADIDGDGDLDLFVGRSPFIGQSVTQGNIFFYENVGTPQVPDFQFITSNYLIWDCGFSSTPRLVDIDADGDPDLFSHIGDRMLLYRNQGSLEQPFFVYESDQFGGIQVFDLMPWFCDIDADGDYDLFAGESAIPGPPGLHLFINRGTPQQPDFVLYSDDLIPGVFSQSSVILSPILADIDADGDYDLFVSDDDPNFYFFKNVGSPTNFQFQLESSQWQGISIWDYSHNYGCFHDVDSDGDLDLFIDIEAHFTQPWEDNLLFYRNVGTPQSANMVLENEDLFPELMIWNAAPYLLDIDQDDDGDLFVGDQWGGIRFFRNVTGEPPAVPPVMRHPQAGLELSLGPNPANPVTWISFSLPAPQEATLAIYNILGCKVTTLASGLQPAGIHSYLWNASQNASGVYIVRLEMAKYTSSQRVTVVK